MHLCRVSFKTTVQINEIPCRRKFRGAIFRGLLRHNPKLDIVRVQDMGLMALDDLTILEWAFNAGRILLTHDRKTMPRYAYQRMAEGKSIAGMIVIKSTIPVSQVIAEIALIEVCSTTEEWVNMVQDIPL